MTMPFAAHERQIAWRYLRARRAEGGVSTMTWISLIGITLAVFALIATLALRAGLRSDFVDQILGAEPHARALAAPVYGPDGRLDRAWRDYGAVAHRLAAVDGVVAAAPVVRGQAMATANGRSAGVEIHGMRPADLRALPLLADPEWSRGALDGLEHGIALGAGIAAELGLRVGDRVRIISPDGVKTAFGTSPRISAWEVVYVFRAGRPDIDRTRAYLPLAEAQAFLNREGRADEIALRVAAPQAIDALRPALARAAGGDALIWTWEDASGAFLRALHMQDNAIFIVLAILILIAALNIVSGLIMLVKNKGRDIGILRTMGLPQGAVLRVFFLCGAAVGTAGTVLGIALGVVFALNIDHVYALVDSLSGRGVADLEAQGFIFPSAVLEPVDILATAALSLGLSWFVTLFPARRAARMNPVEALRYE
jgi:lipoprotein-releasing system permease protein